MGGMYNGVSKAEPTCAEARCPRWEHRSSPPRCWSPLAWCPLKPGPSKYRLSN